MILRLQMPWFAPLAAGVAWACTRAALRLRTGEGRRVGEVLLMLGLGWCPLALWLFLQYFPELSR